MVEILNYRNALPLGSMLLEYRLESVLGAGGFGMTYLAYDSVLDKRVAIKEYLPVELAVRALDGAIVPINTGSDYNYKWGLDRFLQEARLLAKFSHPNIVAVSRFFEANGTAYMVMNYESGLSLSQLLKRIPQPDEAMLTRILLLLSLSWIIHLEQPLFSIFTFSISGRDLILLIGGLFLIGKSTMEIHDKLEGKTEEHSAGKARPTLTAVVIQIGLLDIVFSLDSVITAVGMARELLIMILAVIIAVLIMLFASDGISKFVNGHPTVKILALSFLLLIGTSLLMEGLHQEIPKGYIYFAMAFSVFVEMLNLRIREGKPVVLHQTYEAESPAKTRPEKKRPH